MTTQNKNMLVRFRTLKLTLYKPHLCVKQCQFSIIWPHLVIIVPKTIKCYRHLELRFSRHIKSYDSRWTQMTLSSIYADSHYDHQQSSKYYNTDGLVMLTPETSAARFVTRNFKPVIFNIYIKNSSVIDWLTGNAERNY